MSIQQAYNLWSTTYDTDPNLTRDLDQAAAARVLGEQTFDSALEIGCGTGKNTPFYARISQRLAAVDFSAGMLQKARGKSPGSAVSFTLADLNRPWPFRPRAFQLVACDLVLEHVADLPFIFVQAARVLTGGGRFFVCELHPFRQYLGKKAVFVDGEAVTEVDAYVHHVSDFLQAAQGSGMALLDLQEWWHERDTGKPPRLISFVFTLA